MSLTPFRFTSCPGFLLLPNFWSVLGILPRTWSSTDSPLTHGGGGFSLPTLLTVGLWCAQRSLFLFPVFTLLFQLDLTTPLDPYAFWIHQPLYFPVSPPPSSTLPPKPRDEATIVIQALIENVYFLPYSRPLSYFGFTPAETTTQIEIFDRLAMRWSVLMGTRCISLGLFSILFASSSHSFIFRGSFFTPNLTIPSSLGAMIFSSYFCHISLSIVLCNCLEMTAFGKSGSNSEVFKHRSN